MRTCVTSRLFGPPNLTTRSWLRTHMTASGAHVQLWGTTRISLETSGYSATPVAKTRSENFL